MASSSAEQPLVSELASPGVDEAAGAPSPEAEAVAPLGADPAPTAAEEQEGEGQQQRPQEEQGALAAVDARAYYSVPEWARAATASRNEDVAAELCLPWLRSALVASLLLQGAMYALSGSTTTCAGGRVHVQLWVCLAALPALAFRAFVEWKAVTNIAPPVAKRCRWARESGHKGFEILGRQVRFWLWLTVCSLCSLLNFVDLGADSIFAAMMNRSLTCGHSGKLTSLWRASWAQSLPHRFGVPAPDLGTLVAGSWCLTLVQLLWPLLRSLEQWVMSNGRAGYRSAMFGTRASYSDLGFELGEASGMTSLRRLQFMKAQSGASHPYAENVVEHTFGLANAMPMKVLFSWVGENAVQLNLQTTLFELNRRASREEGGLSTAELLPLFSIATSLLTTLLKLLEAYDFFQLMAKVEVRVAEQPGELLDWASHDLRLMRRGKWATRIGCGLLLLTLGYAVAKVVGAFACEDSLWNVTGCVALDD